MPHCYPFLSDAWQQALLDAAVVAPHPAAPWQLLEMPQPQAWLPLYCRHDSSGEYVFDQLWAQASQRAGLAYYPKLVTAVPYTPVEGPRWRAPAQRHAGDWVMEQVEQALSARQASGWHLLFAEPAQRQQLAGAGLIERLDCHFRWYNRDYQNFDDFLAALQSRKRKNMRKERQRAQHGLQIERAVGEQIPATWWQAFYPCYAQTYFERGRRPYLSPRFFDSVQQRLAPQLMMVAATAPGQPQPLATALYLFDDHALYGRYWGALAAQDALHFELCYYQGIEFAIERGLRSFDPGVQGEHKLLRGFEPVLTASLHWLREPRLQQAVADFCGREAQAVRNYRDDARQYLPFRSE